MKKGDSFLENIKSKVFNETRLTEEEALTLLNYSDFDSLEIIRDLADTVRKKKVGDRVLYASTLYIHPTNLCELNCPFCSFYAKPGWKKAWFLTPEAAEEKIRSVDVSKLTEIHIVGGLWHECNLDYYKELFHRIKTLGPHLIIKALTPVEYDFLARIHSLSVEEVLKKMMSYGLDYLPGGGAEILVETIRKKIAPGKISSDEFLAIHKLAHSLGLRSNITMLFNHIEDNCDIITHLKKVRDLQDETHGFQTFIPLKFGEENNALGKRKQQLKKKNIYLIYAVSRLFLDNFDHLKVLWNYVGIEEALQILRWGANDLSSTNVEEKIITMATSKENKMDREGLEALILGIQRIPYLTESLRC
jgi:CofH subfamily radical SAM domain protein